MYRPENKARASLDMICGSVMLRQRIADIRIVKSGAVSASGYMFATFLV